MRNLEKYKISEEYTYSTSPVEVLYLYNEIKKVFNWKGDLNSKKEEDIIYKTILSTFAYSNRNNLKKISEFFNHVDHTSIRRLLGNCRLGFILSNHKDYNTKESLFFNHLKLNYVKYKGL